MAVNNNCGQDFPSFMWSQTLGVQGMPGGGQTPLSSAIAYAPTTDAFTGVADVNAALNRAEDLLAQTLSTVGLAAPAFITLNANGETTSFQPSANSVITADAAGLPAMTALPPVSALVSTVAGGLVAITSTAAVGIPQQLARNLQTGELEFKAIGATQKHVYGSSQTTGLTTPFIGPLPVVLGVDEINQLPGTIGIDAQGCATFTAPMDGVYSLTYNSWCRAYFTTAPVSATVFASQNYVAIDFPDGSSERGSQVTEIVDVAFASTGPGDWRAFGGDASSASTTVSLSAGETVTFCNTLQIEGITDGVFTVFYDPNIVKTTLSATLVA